jgi:seryl-tRNA synthetase
MSDAIISIIISSAPGLLTSLVALGIALKKTPAEVEESSASADKLAAERSKMEAERQKLIDDISGQVLERADAAMSRMQEQIDGQQREIVELKAANKRLRTWAELLCAQIAGLGHDPVPMPNDDGSC